MSSMNAATTKPTKAECPVCGNREVPVESASERAKRLLSSTRKLFPDNPGMVANRERSLEFWKKHNDLYVATHEGCSYVGRFQKATEIG